MGERETNTPRWLPLESNPSVINEFLQRMGVEDDVKAHDVFGLDEELLGFVPQRVIALFLLYPCNNIRTKRKEQFTGKYIANDGSANLFYVTQHSEFGNACGTIACIHAIANNDLVVGQELRSFIESNRGKSAADVGYALANAVSIHQASEESAESGETETPNREEDLDNHFIAFVEKDGRLIELDGTLDGALDHGPTTKETFLADSAKVVRESFIALDPENPNFNVMALVQTSS